MKSLSERIAHAKQRLTITRTDPALGSGVAQQTDPLDVEFRDLLALVGTFYGYSDEDREAMLKLLDDRSAQGLREIDLTLKEWRGTVEANRLAATSETAVAAATTSAAAPRP